MKDRAIIKIKLEDNAIIRQTIHCGELGVRNKGFFHCPHCGYSCNSDLNASFNFQQRAKPLAIALGLPVNKPIVANNDEIYKSEFSDKPTTLVVGS